SLSDLPGVLDDLGRKRFRPELLFLDASDEVLVRRFKESRRPHPTFGTGRGTILDAIRAEREMLADALARSDRLIDTSGLTPAELRSELEATTRESLGKGLLVTVESFGFKHGIPIDADLVFDVRFLVNPHYVLDLQPLLGTSPEVADYIHRHALTKPYLDKLIDFLLFTLPEYQREGKAYLTIAIGCTGGRHRSVTVAEDIAARLREEGYRTVVYHRDVEREPSPHHEDAR
ncbi:MAG TPA: RNase adapter RapZ, partial [Anaerolineales bacterium]